MSQPAAEALELPEAPVPGDPYLLLSAGGRVYGIPLQTVREVITPRPLTPLPGAPPAARGLANLRGRVVTIVDATAALEARSSPAEQVERIVVVEYRGGPVGLAVEDVTRIAKVTPESVRPADDADSAVTAVGEAEGREVPILDTDRLLAPILA